jgi:hypothetical protein
MENAMPATSGDAPARWCSPQRVAQWVDPEKAISLIRERELKSMVTKFAKHAAAIASKLIY